MFFFGGDPESANPKDFQIDDGVFSGFSGGTEAMPETTLRELFEAYTRRFWRIDLAEISWISLVLLGFNMI